MSEQQQLRKTETEQSASTFFTFSAIRFLVILAVIGMTATTIASFVIAIDKTVSLFEKVLGDGRSDGLVIVSVLEAVDVYLLAVVQLIVAIGLYVLFIGNLRLPEWLIARSLEDLKKPIVDILVVFFSIKGIESFFTARSPLDGLIYVGTVAILIVALTAFRAFTLGGSSESSEKSKAKVDDDE